MKKNKIYLMISISIILLVAIIIIGCTITSNFKSNTESQNNDTQEKVQVGDNNKALVVYFSYSGNTKKLAE